MLFLKYTLQLNILHNRYAFLLCGALYVSPVYCCSCVQQLFICPFICLTIVRSTQYAQYEHVGQHFTITFNFVMSYIANSERVSISLARCSTKNHDFRPAYAGNGTKSNTVASKGKSSLMYLQIMVYCCLLAVQTARI